MTEEVRFRLEADASGFISESRRAEAAIRSLGRTGTEVARSLERAGRASARSLKNVTQVGDAAARSMERVAAQGLAVDRGAYEAARSEGIIGRLKEFAEDIGFPDDEFRDAAAKGKEFVGTIAADLDEAFRTVKDDLKNAFASFFPDDPESQRFFSSLAKLLFNVADDRLGVSGVLSEAKGSVKGLFGGLQEEIRQEPVLGRLFLGGSARDGGTQDSWSGQDNFTGEVLATEFDDASDDIEQRSRTLWRHMVGDLEHNAGAMGEVLGDSLAEGLKVGESAFTEFVAAGKLSFSGLADSIIADLGRSLFSSTISPLVSSVAGSFLGGFGSFFSGLFGGLFHSGGVVGVDGGRGRLLPAAAFIGAPRYHLGGLVGPGEVPAILRQGEGVFTPAQMRALSPAQTQAAAPATVTVEIHNEGSQPQEVAQATPTMRGSDMVVGIITRDLGRDGPISKSMSSVFSLRRRSNG